MVMGELMQETDLLVIGGGPGGYAAAFRAADLGMDVTMVDTALRPGGECLYRGCIPSKTLLYLAELMYDAGRATEMGIAFSKPKIDLDGIRKWKATVIDRLAGGLERLTKQRSIQLLRGRAKFEAPNQVRLQEADISRLKFKHAIIATGSRPIPVPGCDFKKGGRIMSSSGALALADIPATLIIIGAGYVGLELGTVYAAMGSAVTLVEVADRILPGVDADLTKPLQRRLEASFAKLYFNARVKELTEHTDRVEAVLEGDGIPARQIFERVLVAIGRRPNSDNLGLENTHVRTNEHGVIEVDDQQRTADERIFAVGDVVSGPQLAHKAIREGKVAAEVIAGEPSAFDVRAIPAIVYTDPQIAWCGMTETEAQRLNRPVRVERFPWKYSGRALTMNATEGMSKIIIDPETERILGIGIVGRDTEGLIAEGVLAIEMGALAQDMALTIHAHPTLSETVEEADEIFLGSSIHVLPNKKGRE